MKLSAGKVKQLSRRLSNRFIPGGLILMYHRITAARPDPWGCCVLPQHFAEQLEVLRRRFQPVPLHEITEIVAGEKPSLLSRRPVAVTFDDGYADNLHAARPLLERYEIPATIFVVSDNVGSGREFWSDEVERLLLEPGSLPSRLRLGINGQKFEWNLGESASYSASAVERDQKWRAVQGTDPTPRHQLCRELYRLLQPLEAGAREQALAELRAQAGSSAAVRETHRFLTVDELRSLAAAPLIEIGGHTVTHPLLSRLAPARQRDEIIQGRLALERILERPVTSFAYPYGDHDAQSPALVREAGFTLACTTRRGVVRPEADRFTLPRVEVRDWNGREFAAWLTHWLYDSDRAN